MAKCSICGKELETRNMEWKLGKIHVKHYECCGKSSENTQRWFRR